VPYLQVPHEEADDRRDESHDQAISMIPFHREEERLDARAWLPMRTTTRSRLEADDAREERLAEPADS